MGEEIRRRKTADPEMDALMVITQALEGLEPEACERILSWAKDRFVEGPSKRLLGIDVDRFNSEMQRIRDYAAGLGTNERALVHAVSHVRSAKELAPVANDPEVADTEAKVREVVNGR
jgi:hypothetical protein